VLLADHPDPRLQAYVVWEPKLGAQETDVGVATRVVSDVRATHFWDESGQLMQRYAQLLGLGEDAWDVYLLYGPDALWDGHLPPRPRFWMHQLAAETPGPRFDPDIFADSAIRILRAP
jgi:hypothetical protein